MTHLFLISSLTISTAITLADNHKTLNTIVFGLLLNDSLQTGDLATLESIAETCPLEGGDAVYEARALVAYYTEKEYDDYVLCAVSERSPKKQQKYNEIPLQQVVLYPNPTTGEVQFHATGALFVRVFNSVGHLQLEKTVTDGRLSLAHLQPGLYRIQIFRDGQMLTMQSVILLNR